MIPITLQTVPVDLLLHIGTFLEDTDESRRRDISGTTLAAILNDYEMLEHYMKKYTPSEDQYIITNEVAISGNLRALKWVTSKKGYPMDEWTCYIAAECGYLQMLQWLRNKGCPWNASTCNAAVQNGNLDMVKWLHSAGCPWDEMTCDWATERHVRMLLGEEILKCLNGCVVSDVHGTRIPLRLCWRMEIWRFSSGYIVKEAWNWMIRSLLG